MQRNSKIRLGFVAAAATLAMSFAVAAPASADPSSPTGQRIINCVGSDTTQDVMNGLSNASQTVIAGVKAIASFDATTPTAGSATLAFTNGTYAVTIPRPFGSGAGQKALSASAQGIAYGVSTTNTDPANANKLPKGLINCARSSSVSSVVGTALTYIPFAGDKVTIAKNASSDFPDDIALGSSTDPTSAFTLRNIYLGNVKFFFDSNGTKLTIVPLLPQTSSGTRAFWVTTALGTTETDIATGGAATDLGNTVAEHDGTFITTDAQIAPYSISQWIAQGNHKLLGDTLTERRGNTKLIGINTDKPIIYSGGAARANPAFSVSRNVYNVVETDALTAGTTQWQVGGTRAGRQAEDQAIQAMFSGSTSAVCQAMANSGIAPYGFSTISNCGSLTTQRGYTLQ